MKSQLLALSLASILVASGIAGTFYFAGAQTPEQGIENEPTIVLENTGPTITDSVTDVKGSHFDPAGNVSLYMMSAIPVNVGNSNWTVLQEISAANNTITSGNQEKSLLDSAFGMLKGLFGIKDPSTALNATSSGKLVLVGSGAQANSSVSIQCAGQEIAKSDVSDSHQMLTLSVTPGNYSQCQLVIEEDGRELGSENIGSLVIEPSNSQSSGLLATVNADNNGEFLETITIPARSADQNAILAIEDDSSQFAISELFAVSGAEAGTSNDNTTVTQDVNSGQNAASQAASQNTTSTSQLDNSSSNATGEATVQVSEQEAEPGSPLAIVGAGFGANATVQIYINSLQITNIITNVKGSFNTVVIVPTTVANGTAEVTVKTGQTNIIKNVNIAKEDKEHKGPATIRFTSVSAADNARSFDGAPVSVFDASTGELVDSAKTPFALELKKGTYSIFYSDFKNFDFASAQPGSWTDTPDGGSGLLTVRQGHNSTLTAMYNEVPTPATPPTPAKSDLILKAEDIDHNALAGMFVSVYNAETGNRIKQGFTELRIDDLGPGTYPVFFANFGNMSFVSASPGDWVQTPYGGAGLVTIPDDGKSHEVIVTATFDKQTTVVEDQFKIKTPLDVSGQVFTITSNQTRPQGPFEISGVVHLKVGSEDPSSATLTAYLISAREDSNKNVNLESQRSRDHDTFQITDFKPSAAAPAGPNSFIVTGTADLLLNGDMYSDDEAIRIVVRGGEELTPTNIEIQFQGDLNYSAADRLETLYAVITEGFQ